MPKSCLNELQNSPVTNKSKRKDTYKIDKLRWIQIIGSKLQKAFKKTLNHVYIKLMFKIVTVLKYAETRQSCYLIVMWEYTNSSVRAIN